MDNKTKAYISQLGLKMDGDKAKIVEALSNGSKNLDILKMMCPIKHTTLTARLSDLTDAGIIQKTSTKGRYSIYRLSTAQEMAEIQKQRLIDKKRRWLKLGREMGWIDEVVELNEMLNQEC